MKKHKRIILIVGVVLILILLICCKIFLKSYYINSVDIEGSQKVINKLNNEQNINIYKSNYQGKYLEYKNIKIANEFESFQLKHQTQNNESYALEKEAIFVIGTKYNEIEKLREMKDICAQSESVIEKTIHDNNLKNDTDLLNYLKEYNFSTKGYLEKTEQLKTDCIISNYIIITSPSFSGITYIEGDYNGYMLELDTGYDVVLEKNNKQYIFSFYNQSEKKYFTKEKIYDLISTIVIE